MVRMSQKKEAVNPSKQGSVSSNKNSITKFYQNTFFHVLIIVTISILAYTNTLRSPFVYDDIFLIEKNEIIRNLRNFIDFSEVHNLTSIVDLVCVLKSRYVVLFTFALNYKLHGLNVTGYHITNIFIHLLNGLLVYRLILLTFRTPIVKMSSLSGQARWIALFIALFFVAHPLQTQAVTYIWQRCTSLATLFYLLSLVLYIESRIIHKDSQQAGGSADHVNLRSRICYFSAIIATCLAMYSKEIAFTLPITLCVYEFIFFKGKCLKRVGYLIPFILTMLIIPLTILSMESVWREFGEPENIVGPMRARSNLPRYDYFLTEITVIVTYLRLVFFPVNQNLWYDYPIYSSVFKPQVILSGIFLFSILFLGGYLLYKAIFQERNVKPEFRLISFGIFLFFISISVESSFIPIMNVIEEHRMYLPSVGIFTAVTVLLFVLKDHYRITFKKVILCCSTVVILLSLLTYTRNAVWQDEVTLWQDVTKKAPLNYIAHGNLAQALFKKGQYNEAMDSVKKALDLPQCEKNTRINYLMFLAVLYQEKGELYEVLKVMNYCRDELTRLNVQNDKQSKLFREESHYRLGILYIKHKKYHEALEQLRECILLNPRNARAFNNIGVAYIFLNRYNEAETQIQKALDLYPDYGDAQNNLKGLRTLRENPNMKKELDALR
jgi:tetratricopeptide (TPR) repeat protein